MSYITTGYTGPITYMGRYGETSTWDSVWMCRFCKETIPACAHHTCPNQFNPSQAPEEEPVQDNLIDNSLADELTAMRDKRDSAARYAQTKNDMASLYEAAAVFLRTQADMMYREINEGVPMTPDAK